MFFTIFQQMTTYIWNDNTYTTTIFSQRKFTFKSTLLISDTPVSNEQFFIQHAFVLIQLEIIKCIRHQSCKKFLKRYYIHEDT